METHNPYTPPKSNLEQNATDNSGIYLASPWTRLGAALVDGLLMMLVLTPLQFFTGYLDRVTENAANGISFTPEALLWTLGGIGLWIALNFKFLGQGQTIGKKVLKIQVQRKDGSPVGMGRYLTHRFLPIQGAALIPLAGGILILIDCLLIFRKDRNTLHDDLADTKVVQLRN